MKLRKRGRGQYIETRLSVNRGGDWRSYTDTLPKNCAVIGTVTEGANDTGALVQMLDTRNYLKIKKPPRRGRSKASWRKKSRR
jgi:hypothetical protein